MQSPQQFDDGYKHTSCQNNRIILRLKAIQAEYYSGENGKS